MKVLMCSRHFPKGHPKQGQPTWFVEKVWKSIWVAHKGSANPLYPWWEIYDEAFPSGDIRENIHQHQPKHHTIRAGSRFKPGDMVSLRVWSDKPYRSKQIEFAQVEVKKTWAIRLTIVNNTSVVLTINGVEKHARWVHQLAANDGLDSLDFINWFNIHPKKKQQVFKGQIICWSESVNYSLMP